MELDPYQLTNLAGNPTYAAAQTALAARLAGLRSCAGPSCRQKPILKLKLPRSQRENGRSCRSAKGFRARVRGADAGALTEVTFRVGSKRSGASDRSGPFKKTLRPELLRRSSKPEVRAIAETVDGRALSLQKAIRIAIEAQARVAAEARESFHLWRSVHDSREWISTHAEPGRTRVLIGLGGFGVGWARRPSVGRRAARRCW